MSAYMVDRDHVRFLVSAARLYARKGSRFGWYFDGKWTYLDPINRDEASALGQLLWNANLKSINARYPDTVGKPENAPGPVDETFIYAHSKDWPFDMVAAVQVLKSISCLEYQSCEFDGWEASEARAVCKALENAAINALPGYDDAEWGAPELPAARGGR